MPRNDKRVKITLECTECKRRNYITMKSKVNDRERLEMKKYCSHDRRHTTSQRDQVTRRPPGNPRRVAGSVTSPFRGQ